MQLKYGGSSSEDHQFVRGIPIYTISQVLDKIISGANGLPLLINGIKRPMPLIRILEVELYPTLLSKARSFGLSDNWIQVHFSVDTFSFLFLFFTCNTISCFLMLSVSNSLMLVYFKLLGYILFYMKITFFKLLESLIRGV